ncbi:MAG: NAD-glutamate dehydrogenase domain-containing protein [Phycisphaerales bacterium]
MSTVPSTSASSAGAPADPAALVDELVRSFRDTAEQTVPWFLQQMPSMYFQDTDSASQLAHLRAIIAARASGRPLELSLRSEDGNEFTFLRPKNYPGVLAELVGSLPLDRSLRAAKIHTTLDGELVLDTFVFGDRDPFDPKDPRQAEKLRETIEFAKSQDPDWCADDITAYFRGCAAEYVSTLTPLRMCKHHAMFMKVSGLDGAEVELELEADPNLSRLSIAVANARTRTMLERTASLLARHRIGIERAYLDIVADPPHGSVTFVGFVIQGPDGGPIDPKSDLWRRVKADLLRIKWVDFRCLEIASRHPGFDVARAELLLAFSQLLHQLLAGENRFAYTRERIQQALEQNFPTTLEAIDLLVARFDPASPMPEAEFTNRLDALRTRISETVSVDPDRAVLLGLVRSVGSVLRTNFFLPRRFGLAMRIDPELLRTEERPDLPYGVFFVHGRGCAGFHVRFQDIARGGLRVVRPDGEAQHARESERLYNEAYGLAFAQQLKNKDIPEGGAKAAVLIEAGAEITRSVKSFVDSLLDLITPQPETKRLVVDRFGRDELIYLGPDENITPQHIEWIVERARLRGYSMPTAFMSSKPGAGINHKVYGVTSEGVNVFLGVMLEAVGIDPRTRPFSVKITGGPDGDVAGNMIKILHRDHGAAARIVGIADGSGCGEDPDGLDHAELLRLVELSLPIADFDRSKLGPRGRVASVKEPDGAQLRNTMHNRVKADAFVPAGGRPATIHEGNWREFLAADGTPSSRLIVEGANLFLTPGAREKLSQHGVLIVKDSSANKCGVITSSFEICACMALDEKEFMSIKPRFVEEVLATLRQLAQEEALLLMQEGRRRTGSSLPAISTRLSKVANAAAAAIAAAIPTWPEEDRECAKFLVFDHLPKVLVETAAERVWTRMPAAYLNWMQAKRLASSMLYREGIDFLEDLESQAIAELSRRYLAKDLQMRKLITEVEGSDLAARTRVAEVLRRSGTRGALQDL